MKKLILTIASVAFIFSSTIAQNKVVDVKSNKRESVRGTNTNIKSDVPHTDVEMPKPEGYVAPDLQRGANFTSLNKVKRTQVRGTNDNIKSEEPTKDVEKVRPTYSNTKSMDVKRSTTNKMRGASTNIVNDEPATDNEVARPANYEGPNTKGATIKNVARNPVTKTRGANPNIKKDMPSVDIEEARPSK